ncbi:MAG: hypothetical protein DRJ65_00175 [Acidobacteria bacterium]|nr:MAG: hypothetical protein DRJ65_00175 [Acidobacteriota bacterium]
MICNHNNDDRKALAVAGAFILVCLMAYLLTGCASTPPAEDDPCKDCPFTDRPAQVWTAPNLEPVPDYPALKADNFTPDQITADPAAYIQALITDHLVLKTSVVDHHHWAESLVKAIKAAEATRPD